MPDDSKDFSKFSDSITTHDETHSNPIAEDTLINTADLEWEFQNQPSKYAWWAFLAEHAKSEVEQFKNELSILYAQLDAEVRNQARMDEEDSRRNKQKPIRMTETMVENMVKTNPVYQELMESLIEAKKNAGLAAAGRSAMDHRRDMLIQIGANYRTEGQADPVILKEAAREKARERAKKKEAARKLPPKLPPKQPPGKKVPGKKMPRK